jgi:fluoride exporter
MSYVMVFLGAGIGGALRHGINSAALRLGLTGFPFHTLFINAAGSLAMGLIAGWFALRGQAPQLWRLFLTTGVLGGFTTFSAFSLETVLLWERGEAGAAFAYVAASVLAAIAGLVAGLWIIRAVA